MDISLTGSTRIIIGKVTITGSQDIKNKNNLRDKNMKTIKYQRIVEMVWLSKRRNLSIRNMVNMVNSMDRKEELLFIKRTDSKTTIKKAIRTVNKMAITLVMARELILEVQVC